MEGPFTLIVDTGRDKHPDIPDTHQCLHMAQIMAEFHNILSQALNSACRWAPHISASESRYQSFLQYNCILYELIHSHHDWEEQVYFPAISALPGAPDILQETVEEHETFERPLRNLQLYVEECRQPDAWSPRKFQLLMAEFSQPFCDHLHREPSKFYRFKTCDSAALKAAYDIAEQAILKESDVFRAMPMVLGNENHAYRVNGRPHLHPQILPWFMPYLCYYVLQWRYLGAWQFNSTDPWGSPQGRV